MSWHRRQRKEHQRTKERPLQKRRLQQRKVIRVQGCRLLIGRASMLFSCCLGWSCGELLLNASLLLLPLLARLVVGLPAFAHSSALAHWVVSLLVLARLVVSLTVWDLLPAHDVACRHRTPTYMSPFCTKQAALIGFVLFNLHLCLPAAYKATPPQTGKLNFEKCSYLAQI